MKNILKPSILAACVIAIAMLTLAQNTTILPPKMPQKPQQSEQQAQKILERVRITLKKEGKTIMGLTEVRSATEFNNANFSINYYISK